MARRRHRRLPYANATLSPARSCTCIRMRICIPGGDWTAGRTPSGASTMIQVSVPSSAKQAAGAAARLRKRRGRASARSKASQAGSRTLPHSLRVLAAFKAQGLSGRTRSRSG